MPKTPKDKLSRKNLILSLIVLGIAIPSGSYVTYNYITPTAVQSTYFNKTTTLAGDGTHQARIELTLLNGLNEPMSNINITPQASVGNVSSCTTTAGGTCFVVYTPPRTADNENATIFVSIGNFHQNMQFAITPDQVTQMRLSSNTTQMYTNSSAKVTAILNDTFGNPMPDRAQVNFSLLGGGFLSATSCLTIAGQCSIAYTSPSTATTATVYASTSSIKEQVGIGVVSHQAQVSLFASTTQVYTNGTVKLNVTLKDAFGKLVANGTQVNFSAQYGGRFSSDSCLTVNGQCSVNYNAPSASGSATIWASSGSSSNYATINVKSRLIQNQILSIGNSAAFCGGSWPYYALNLSVSSGERVTWNVNHVSLYQFSYGYGTTYPYKLYLFNSTQYTTFLNLVSNATLQYQQVQKACGSIYTWSNQSNPTVIYCNNVIKKYGWGTDQYGEYIDSGRMFMLM